MKKYDKKSSTKKDKIEFNYDGKIEYKEIEELRNKVQLTSEDVKKYLEENSIKNN